MHTKYMYPDFLMVIICHDMEMEMVVDKMVEVDVLEKYTNMVV